MNAVVDEVLAGSPRYTIKDNGGTTLYDNVQIDLKTQVTTAGTPLNKALFDSIQTDLNTRLLISNKATQAEAEAGSNDTKYMTPQKVQNKLNSLITTTTQSSAGTYTICTFANYTNAKIIKISGQTKRGNNDTEYIFNGSGLNGFNNTTVFNTTPTAIALKASSNSNLQGFEFTIDLASKSITGIYVSKEGTKADIFCGAFTSLTNFQIKLTGSGSSLNATIQANS